MHKALARSLALLLSTSVGLSVAYFALSDRFEQPRILRITDEPDDLGELALPEGAASFEESGGDTEPAEPASRAASTLRVPPTESGLLRRSLTEEQVARVWRKELGGKVLAVYDPDTYFWEQSDRTLKKSFEEHPRRRWTWHTNDWGCRQTNDVRAEKPDLRILVTGDSHTAGVVPYRENFVHLVETSLANRSEGRTVEAINAGKGEFDFYNYVGVLEKFASLDSDVFVLAVFAGNDFMACTRPYRLFNRMKSMPTPSSEEWKRVMQVDDSMRGLIPQDVNQYLVFRRSPEDVQHAATAARQALATMARVCAARGMEFLVVLIPPCSSVQRDLLQPEFDEAVQLLELGEEDLAVTDRLADGLLADAAEFGARTIDMRPIFRASPMPCYWRSDLHINTRGHLLVAREVAEALLPLLER